MCASVISTCNIFFIDFFSITSFYFDTHLITTILLYVQNSMLIVYFTSR